MAPVCAFDLGCGDGLSELWLVMRIEFVVGSGDLPMDGIFPAPNACALPGNSTSMTQRTSSMEVAGPHLRPEEGMTMSAYHKRLGDSVRARRDGLDGESVHSGLEIRSMYVVVKQGEQELWSSVREESRG